MTRPITIKIIFWVLLTAAAYLGLGYYTERSQFYQLVFWFALAFVAYYQLSSGKYFLKNLILVAIGCRLLFLFCWPNLSDDYFRFIWDGRLIMAGINPFEQLPSYYVPIINQIPGFNLELFQHLNSPHYFSVYPPVCQFIFAASAWLSPHQDWGMVLSMRVLLIAADLGNIFLLIKLLRYFKKPTKQVVWYALNPLVIVELSGNLHFEALVLFFLLGSLYLILQQKLISAGVLFGLAVGVKLLPLLLMPLVLARLGWRMFLVFGTAVFICLAVLFLPFLSEPLFLNMGQSLNLYFQKFEFNASIYYLLRGLGSQLLGYNPIAFIGPFLSLSTAIIICWASFRSRKSLPDKLPLFLLFAFTVYFFLATTVHPWYLTTLVALSVLTPYRFGLVWSGLVIFSYATYQTAAYHENLYLVALEYCLVFGYLIFEFLKQKNLKNSLLPALPD